MIVVDIRILQVRKSIHSYIDTRGDTNGVIFPQKELAPSEHMINFDLR